MKRILVVDDDPLICGAICIWLKERGFAVVVANGGEAGLTALEGSAFDLMIVDIFMPHMKGFESVRVFHQRAANGTLDRHFRLRLRRTTNASSGFCERGSKARRHALSAQAFHTIDAAECHRRVSS
jgi:CheY-like chemotaxis protein